MANKTLTLDPDDYWYDLIKAEDFDLDADGLYWHGKLVAKWGEDIPPSHKCKAINGFKALAAAASELAADLIREEEAA